jgi:myosin heavy subunit
MKLRAPGEWVWVPDEDEAFFPAQVHTGHELGKGGQFKTEDGRVIDVDAKTDSACTKMELMSLQNLDDMVLFNDLAEASLLHNVRKRFNQDQIYTYVGDILVAVNPFKKLEIYTPLMLEKYQQAAGSPIGPHIFAVADVSYREMVENKQNQAICIAGESGAGKTETMKLVLQYLGKVSKMQHKGDGPAEDKKSIEMQILQTNPLSEAFGNAKTVRNNNSSRFGKWTALSFNLKGAILGAFITDYLLEKSRVSFQAKDERNYHSFYQIIAGASVRSDLKHLELGDVSTYEYLTKSGSTTAKGIDDHADFEELVESMDLLGIALDQQDSIFRVLSAILHLGNLKYEIPEGAMNDSATVTDPTKKNLEVICKMLKVEMDTLEEKLLTRKMGTKSVIHVPYKPQQAVECRDALSKALYGAIFNWVIHAINKTLSKNIGGKKGGRRMSVGQRVTQQQLMIGVLDIFGFEIFEVNSFEQLCINFCNEKLQNHFNDHIFNVEQQIYAAEGVSVADVEFKNNEATLMLLEGKGGCLSILDEEIKVPKASDTSFLSKLIAAQDKHPNFAKPRPREKDSHLGFYIKHFAGDVCYKVTNFLEKNRDTLQEDLKELIASSEDEDFVKGLLDLGASNQISTDAAEAAAEEELAKGPKKRGAKKGKETLGMKFKKQLGQLVTSMQACSPRFVRCMKPNHKKVSEVFQGPMMMQQLRCAGLLEVCRIRKIGYPGRMMFAGFLQRFSVIKPTAAYGWDRAKPDPEKGDVMYKAFAEKLVEALVKKGVLGAKDVAVGHKKLFMRSEATVKLEDGRSGALFGHVQSIQTMARGKICRQRIVKYRELLQNLKEAVASCEEDEITAAMAACADGMPHKAAKHPEIVKATKVKGVLSANRSMLDQIASGELDAGDASVELALKALVKSFEDIGAGADVVNNAKEFVKSMEERREALKALTRAKETARADPQRLTTSLEKTLEYATKVGVVKSELAKAQELVEALAAETACLLALKLGVEARNLEEVDEQLKEADRLKLTEQEELLNGAGTNVFSWPTTTEEPARQLITTAKDLNKILQAEAEAALKELTQKREMLLSKLREVCDRAAGLILQQGAEAKAETCEVIPMEELLEQAVELEIAEDVGEIEFAKSLVAEVREKQKQSKTKQRNLEKETGRMIRSAQKRKDLVKLREALEKGALVLKEDHPDMVSGNALLADLLRKDEQKTAKSDLKEHLLDCKRIRKDPSATTMMEQQGLKNLQISLRKCLSLGFNESNTPEIVQARELISTLQSSLETKIAKNFLQSNGFSNRDWMAGSRQRNRTKDGKFIQMPPVDLSIVDVNNELWLVFTHYTVRLNSKEPEIMRKDAYMTLMRDCNIVSPKAKKGKVMEADMNTIHGVVQSQSPGRRFVFSSFKKTLGKIAIKVFPEKQTGVRAAQAMEKLLSEWILPHAHKRLKIPIVEQTSLPEIVELSKIFAPSLKLIFQFFAVMPTKEEKESGRHLKRKDIDEFIGQSLRYDSFMSFASVFSLSSGTGASQAALNNTDLAAIFLDSIMVEESDVVGGLTFEEFWQALVRMALVFYSRRTSQSESANASDQPEGEGEGESIYDTIIHLFIWMNTCMSDAVPRAISAQEQFMFNKDQFAMSNRGAILQKGAKQFAIQISALNIKKVRRSCIDVSLICPPISPSHSLQQHPTNK